MHVPYSSLCADSLARSLARSRGCWWTVVAHCRLQVHVFEFFSALDPAWEFRGFVVNGQRTALTAYNPWIYDADMVPLYMRMCTRVDPH